MAKSVLELAVGTGQWDAGLKKAKSALDNFTQSQGGLQQALAKDSENMRKFVGMMGQMDSSAKTAKGQMNDYKATIEQLTMQYNRMTESQKQTIGQDYLQSIDQLKQKYQAVNEEIQEMNRSLNNVKAPDIADGVKAGGLFGGGKLDGMLQVFGGNLMTKGVELATSAVTSLISETGDMIKQGVELAKQGEGIRIAFDRLGRGDILDGLREATHGTVTDLELMKAAVKFNDFKLPLDQLGTMLAFAQQKAKDTGQSVDYMVESITNGLGRQSKPILDNLGISAKEIEERMKSTGDFTKAVGAIIRDQMAAAGDYVETAADRAAQANVSLQNKMEELGRKFAPVEEASNQLWTSMKIGILDIIGGPLAELLNGLTEAGRLQNAINNMNGGNNGGPTRIDRMVSMLGNGQSQRSRNTYNKQVSTFDKRINQQQFRIASLSGNDAITRGLRQKAETELKALETMRAEYISRANDVFNHKAITPLKTTTDPKKGTKEDKDEFTEIIGLIGNAQEKVSDLQRQISESWDQNEIVKLNEKLKDAQNELDVLQGKLPKDTLVDITVDVNTADALQKIGDIEGVTIDTKTLTVTADTTEALQRIQKLVAEMNGTIIEMKVVPVITDEDIERSLREQYGKPIEVPVVPKTTGEAIEQEIRVKLAEQNMDADMQTLRTLLETQIKNGIEGIEIPSDTLAQAIMGEGVDIPDEYWSKLQDQFNEELKKMDIDPINIDFKTGKEKDKKSKGGPMDDTKKVVSGLNQVASGLQQMGIELPEGVNQVLGVVNGLMTIIGGITSIISAAEVPAQIANTAALWALTEAMWANTFFGFSNGGIVHAANGWVGGNSLSGDRVPAMLNSGELVLNRAQQGVIANALEGGNAWQNLRLDAVIRGEQIRLVLNNNGRRTGRGEYVQTNRR